MHIIISFTVVQGVVTQFRIDAATATKRLSLTLFYIRLCRLSVEEAEICTSNICSYDFVLRHHKTMTFVTKVPGAVRPTAYDVILNGSNLTIAANLYRPANRSGVIDPNVGKTVSSDDVITADGYPRYIVTINDQFPGPTIKVTQGAKVN